MSRPAGVVGWEETSRLTRAALQDSAAQEISQYVVPL